MQITAILDFKKKSPKPYTVTKEMLMRPSTMRDKKVTHGSGGYRHSVEEILFDDSKRNLDYPTSARTIEVRNETDSPIWVIWRENTVQCLPPLRGGHRSGRVTVRYRFTANSWATDSSMFKVDNQYERALFTSIENLAHDDTAVNHNPLLTAISKNLNEAITYTANGERALKTITAAVPAHFTFENIAAEPDGLYLNEFDIVLATEAILHRINHPAYSSFTKANVSSEYIDNTFMANSVNTSIFIADSGYKYEDNQFVKFTYKHIRVPVIRNYKGADGVYLIECTKFNDEERNPVVNKTYFPLEEGFSALCIKSSIEELIRIDNDIHHKQEIEKLKLTVEEQQLRLKQRECEIKNLDLKFQTALNIHKTNNEHRRDSINHYRGEIKTIKEEQKEDRRFKRDMLSDTAKMITTVLSLAAAIVIFANKSK